MTKAIAMTEWEDYIGDLIGPCLQTNFFKGFSRVSIFFHSLPLVWFCYSLGGFLPPLRLAAVLGLAGNFEGGGVGGLGSGCRKLCFGIFHDVFSSFFSITLSHLPLPTPMFSPPPSKLQTLSFSLPLTLGKSGSARKGTTQGKFGPTLRKKFLLLFFLPCQFGLFCFCFCFSRFRGGRTSGKGGYRAYFTRLYTGWSGGGTGKGGRGRGRGREGEGRYSRSLRELPFSFFSFVELPIV